MDVVAAANFILARIGEWVDCHIVFVPLETGKHEMIKVTEGENRETGDVRDLPDDPWVRPAADGAVQAHALLLPHGVGTGFDHKLWGVHQAVYVHALKMFLVFMDLKRGDPKITTDGQEFGQDELFRGIEIRDAETTRSSVHHVGLAHAGIQLSRA